MSVLRFSADSPIDSIAVRKSAGGGVRAYLYAGDAMTDADRLAVKTLARKQGWQCVPTEHNGRDCLEVRGMHNIEKLQTCLKVSNMLQGDAQTVVHDDVKISLRDRLNSNLLRISGILFLVGDLGFVGYGMLQKRLNPARAHWEEQLAGIAYGTGSLTFTLFGRGDKSDHQARDIAARLHEKLAREGITVPDTETSLLYDKSSGKPEGNEVLRFLQTHPAEIGNGANAVAGALLGKAAFRQSDPKSRWLEASLGASTFLSGIAPSLIKETPPDPNLPAPTNPVEKIKRAVQERPNRIPGFGYMYSTAVHGIETIRNIAGAKQKYPGKEKLAVVTYGLRGLFVGMNLLAEFVLSLSSKGHGSGVQSDKSLEDTALALTANVIHSQPAADQERMTCELARHFLARSDILGGDPDTMQNLLRERVGRLNKNRWITVNADARAAPVKEPSAEALAAQPEAPNWGERMQTRQARPQQLSPA